MEEPFCVFAFFPNEIYIVCFALGLKEYKHDPNKITCLFLKFAFLWEHMCE